MKAQCQQCGNQYDKAFEIIWQGKNYYFDCFECAIHVLAPTCKHCGCRIIGHGMEKENIFYCCAQCARHEGIHEELADRA